MKIFYLIGMLVIATGAYAQKKAAPKDEAVLTYGFKSNGKEVPGELVLYIKKNRVYLATGGNQPATEIQYLDTKEKVSYQYLPQTAEATTLRKPFSEYASITPVEGMVTKKAKTSIRSNSIDIWYTDALELKATPNITIGPDLGLVVKIVRNGNSETYLKNITYRPITEAELNWPTNWGNLVTEPGYMAKVIQSRYHTLSIFDKEVINFTKLEANPVGEQFDKTYRFAGGTVILKKVSLPKIGMRQNLFVELVQYSNGDAYDRTGCVFAIPAGKDSTFLDGLFKGKEALPIYKDRDGVAYEGVVANDRYEPALELMRFFTTFGVRHFNQSVQIEGYQWSDSSIFKQDITELAPALNGDVWIGVFIGNYDGGGHIASLKLHYYPGLQSAKPERTKLPYIRTLFNTLNIMEMAGQNYGTMFKEDSLTVTVDVPQGYENFKLRYTTTGHGGWGGGDEFNRKLNEIFVNGERVYHFIPWREDCATYRLDNPSSGNFGTGLSSSDLSRSNWCPGTITLPVEIPLPNLTPGKHTFKVAIPLGAREGGSFSAWCVTGILIADPK
jgi:hypothetical protein